MSDSSTIPPSGQPLILDPLPLIIPACGISLLAGAPSVGKTALLAPILKAFRDGTPIFGRQPSPLAGVGFLSADRSWERQTRVWFERANFPDIRHYSLIDDGSFSKRRLRKKHERVDLLAELLDRLDLLPNSLVVVDPISLFLGGNLNDYDTCMVACMEIRERITARGLTILATAHASKQRTDKKERYLRLQDRILGSTALFGFTDTQLYLASPQEIGEKYYAFLWHPHLAEPETFNLMRDKSGLFVPSLRQAAAQGVAAVTADMRLLELIPYEPVAITRFELLGLVEAIPLSSSTVDRYLRRFMLEKRVTKSQHGAYSRVKASSGLLKET